MSRVAKNPVTLPAGVEAQISPVMLSIKGSLGQLNQPLIGNVTIQLENGALTFAAANESREAKAMSGTLRALAANMVQGVSKGFERKLQLIGVGYRAQAAGDVLNLTLGFSHPVVYPMPAGIKVATPTQTEVVLTGSDKQLLGQVAAEIRAYRPPEPYKGKGVRYVGEVVTIKETKKK